MPVVDTRYEHHRMTPLRIAVAIVLAVILLTVAWMLYTRNRDADAPVRPTTQTRPDDRANITPGDSVTQEGDETSDTNPSSSGTGNNTTLNQDGVGVQ